MSWNLLEREAPALATVGAERLHGRVSYLATVTAAGAPRVHPVTPIVGQGRLFLFMEPTSPKGRDLERGSRFSLHCGVEDDSGGGGEFVASGRATRITDTPTRELAASLASYSPADRYILFELAVEDAMATNYSADGVKRVRWRAQETTS